MELFNTQVAVDNVGPLLAGLLITIELTFVVIVLSAKTDPESRRRLTISSTVNSLRPLARVRSRAARSTAS